MLGSRYTDGQGKTSPIDGYRELTTSLYGEVGFAPGWAGLMHWDVARVFTLASADETWVRPGDLHLGSRWAALHFGRSGVLALEASLGLPIAPSKEIAPLVASDGTPLGGLRAGAGVFDLSSDLQIGWAWSSVFASASLGWYQRLGGQDGGPRWRTEVGARWWRMQSILRLSGWHPLEFGNAPRLDNPAASTNGSAATSTVIELGLDLGEGWGVGTTTQISLAGLGVKRHARGPAFSLFLTYQH